LYHTKDSSSDLAMKYQTAIVYIEGRDNRHLHRESSTYSIPGTNPWCGSSVGFVPGTECVDDFGYKCVGRVSGGPGNGSNPQHVWFLVWAWCLLVSRVFLMSEVPLCVKIFLMSEVPLYTQGNLGILHGQEGLRQRAPPRSQSYIETLIM